MSAGWQVVHLQVSDAGPLLIRPGYEGLYACFWSGHIPLGHAELLANELPLSSDQARELTATVIAPALQAYRSSLSSSAWMQQSLLRELEETSHGMGRSLAHETSVVVCTRNRPTHLERCLQSLAAQTTPPAEIIVVDNTPGDGLTAQVVASHAGIRYVIEPRPGASRARNAGIRNCSGALIAFTDDDMVVSPEWLSALTTAFGDLEVAATSGIVFPGDLRTHAQLVLERELLGLYRDYAPRLDRGEFSDQPEGRATPPTSSCAGGNMAIRRSAFDRVGGFDERLGPGAAGSGEDYELWHRILLGGGSGVHVPTAVVHHYHPIERAMLGKAFHRYLRGQVVALLTMFTRSRQWRYLGPVVVRLPLEGIEVLTRWLLGSQSDNRAMLMAALGGVAGVPYWLSTRSIRRGRGGDAVAQYPARDPRNAGGMGVVKQDDSTHRSRL